MSHSKTSYFPPRDHPQARNIEVENTLRRSASSPPLRDLSRRLFLHQDHSGGSRSKFSSAGAERSRAGLVMMESWMKLKAEVPKLSYANILILLTAPLAGLVIFPVISAPIRDALAPDGVGRVGKALFGEVQDSPILVAGTGFLCGVVGSYWHWGSKGKYVWLTRYTYLPTLLDSVLAFFTTFINICATRGRYWLVRALIPFSVTTSATLVAVMIYLIHSGVNDSAWEHRAMKEAHVAR